MSGGRHCYLLFNELKQIFQLQQRYKSSLFNEKYLRMKVYLKKITELIIAQPGLEI